MEPRTPDTSTPGTSSPDTSAPEKQAFSQEAPVGGNPTQDIMTQDIMTQDIPTQDIPTHDLPFKDDPILEGAVLAGVSKPARPKGPHAAPVVLGLVALAMAALIIANETTGLRVDWSRLGPGAIVGLGVLLVVLGAVGLVRRRDDG